MTGQALESVGAVARSWEAACQSCDTDRIVAHLSDDAAVWYNFNPQAQHTKGVYRAMLESSKTGLANRRYKDRRVHLHPGGFVEQATLEGETPGGPVETPFLLIATVEGDRITRIAQYFDTTIMHQLGLVPV